nr:NADH-quinone oxidoreductase subunit M [Nocardioides sp.]
VAVTAIVLSAVYVLWLYQRAFTGPVLPEGEAVTDLDRREVGTLAPLMLALVLFGFYPMPLLDIINPNVETTLTHVGVNDEAPTVPAADDDVAEGAHP